MVVDVPSADGMRRSVHPAGGKKSARTGVGAGVGKGVVGMVGLKPPLHAQHAVVPDMPVLETAEPHCWHLVGSASKKEQKNPKAEDCHKTPGDVSLSWHGAGVGGGVGCGTGVGDGVGAGVGGGVGASMIGLLVGSSGSYPASHAQHVSLAWTPNDSMVPFVTHSNGSAWKVAHDQLVVPVPTRSAPHTLNSK